MSNTSVPQSMTEKTLQQMQSVVDYVWDSSRCDFYRTFWSKHTIENKPEITTYEDFCSLPLLTKSDLQQAEDPDARNYCDIGQSLMLTSTSGTTANQPLFSWRGPALTEYFTLLAKSGATRALFVWGYHGSFALTTNQIEYAGLPTIAIDPHQIKTAGGLIERHAIDTLILSPSVASFLPHYLASRQLCSQITHLSLVGEACTAAMYTFLQEKFPNAAIYNTVSSSESQGVWLYNTPDCNDPLSTFHVSDEYFAELSDTNEIIITTLNTTVSLPLIRYRSGDCGNLTQSNCTCDKSNQQIKLFGRQNADFVRTQGLEFHIEHIANSITQNNANLLPVVSATISEATYNNNVVAYFEVTITKTRNCQLSDVEIIEDVTNRLLTLPVSNTLTYKQAIEKNLVTTPSIIISSDEDFTFKRSSIRKITA